MSSDGTAALIGEFPSQPTYKEVENAVKEVKHLFPIKVVLYGRSEGHKLPNPCRGLSPK